MWVAVVVLVFNNATLFSTKLIYYKRSVFRITFTTYYSYYYTRFKNDSILLELVMS